ncbi:DsrE family protein [Halobacterium zhouii]|uniref:DsrE family protein n=1 Tax=Halobacterium zhouii TaxID=2902624 RepID=UPI001E55961C|nr:DsrE family protein [Halobacterium zhouii]
MQTVFHHARREEADAVLSNVENLLDDDSVDVDAVAVVANAHGVYTLTEESRHPERVRELAEGEGVEFLACANSLASRDASEDDLLEGVETVPAGVGALTRLQSDGYAYVKD